MGKGLQGIVVLPPLQYGEGVNLNPMAQEDSQELSLEQAGCLPSVGSNVEEVCLGIVEQSFGQRAQPDTTGAVTAVGAP